MSKNKTSWSKANKNTTSWGGNPAFANATKLNDTTVKLNSTTVTLLGYAVGTHFYDQKNNTPWANI